MLWRNSLEISETSERRPQRRSTPPKAFAGAVFSWPFNSNSLLSVPLQSGLHSFEFEIVPFFHCQQMLLFIRMNDKYPVQSQVFQTQGRRDLPNAGHCCFSMLVASPSSSHSTSFVSNMLLALICGPHLYKPQGIGTIIRLKNPSRLVAQPIPSFSHPIHHFSICTFKSETCK